VATVPLSKHQGEALVEPSPQVVVQTKPKSTYGHILKSSAMIGGSSILNVGIGIVRTKAMAVLLGPGGFGLAGMYTSIVSLVQSVAGMGINSSGVRQIAEAVGTDDELRIARTAMVLRRTSIVLGLLGAGLLVVFAKQVSVVTFGTAQRTGAVCLLSLAVFFQLVSAGQSALIQGMRRIADLAKMNVTGAMAGMVISIPIVYFLREKGIAVSLVLVAATTIITSWWYSQKIEINRPTLTTAQIRQETSDLLKLGFAFMISGLIVPGVAYFVRVILLQKIGMAATGAYQSAWTLGGLYVSFILQAMGADFYPRLSAVANDNAECNRLVNEQALIGLLLAGPGVIATLTVAPAVIALFYSSRFGAAVGILRWICLGTLLQVITWPMGFIVIAKGKASLFLLCELAWMIVAVALAWVCITYFGLNGAGIAFFVSYLFHGFMIYAVVNRLSYFRWFGPNKKVCLFFLPSVAAVFCSSYFLPVRFALPIDLLALCGTAAYSVRVLLNLTSLAQLPVPLGRVLTRLGLFPAAEARS
jgi:enterobacterial common antigen flippase